MECELRLRPPQAAQGRRGGLEPFTVGVPAPRGWLRDGATLRLVDHAGARTYPQTSVRDRWPDGSARWVLIDFQADPRVTPALTLTSSSDPAARAAPSLATVTGSRIVVNTGAANFVLGHDQFPLERVTARDTPEQLLSGSGLEIIDDRGRPLAFRIGTITLEENGPVRADVRFAGSAEGEGGGRLDLTARLHFVAGTEAVRMDVTLRNPRRARHAGGFWELGDPGSMLIRSVSIRLAATGGGAAIVRCSQDADSEPATYETPFQLHQHSSGGENWESATHVNRAGTVPLSIRGFRLTSNNADIVAGNRATPIVQLLGDRCQIGMAMERFWENFPKAIEASDSAVTLHVFPSIGDAHEIQGGEQKTHTFWFWVASRDTPIDAFSWCRMPSNVTISPDWCSASEAVPFLTPRQTDPHPAYLALVNAAIVGTDTFVHKREVIDEYGWRHFGEIYADHEGVFNEEPPLVSHYNNQYDAVAGCAYQWLRSGDASWWVLMDDLARHVVDIDIYHTDEDRVEYNHGLFWHTFHYLDAGKSTHRSYPRAGKSNGGGPSGGHLYTTGLMLHYFLTGSRASREAALDLATYVIDADDGRRSMFRWLDSGRTGHVSASGTIDYFGPGRAPANAINALLDGHRLTGEARFLEKAEELVRRSVHPADDIEARNLLDAENRWFYTMFFQTLGKFLQHKQERNQIDAMYAYARASLLAYARWMATHERPYLEHPEVLEYPTETWAAQDMRKSEVFKWASLHADEAERLTFLDRSRFFFNYSVETLSGMATKTLARPVILLLSYGWSEAYFARPHKSDITLPSKQDFGAPQVFVPQRTRAVRKAKLIVGACGIATLAGIAALIAAWWL